MLNSHKKIPAIFPLLLLLSSVAHSQTDDSWVVRNFRVEGAQRISEGTIYNYLPINIGDTLTPQRIREAIRAIYATEFFADVEFRRSADTLVVNVLERPTIVEFTFDGNNEIETEQLEENLRRFGLTSGKVFDQNVLDQVTQGLTEQYFTRGRYAVSVESTVEDIGDNRVRVDIQIQEGERARIRQINIVGNASFDDDEILDDFTLSTGSWLSWIRNDNRYGKEELEGDLETLVAFYMDRGFADFRYDSVQVAISPDNQDIFITINVTEGDRYTISDINLAGDMVVPVEELRALVQANPGEMFSQQLLTISEALIRNRLGVDGYAFSDVRAISDLDEDTLEAEITFFVDPKNRVYVRRINFNGADNVNDEVFRREMRQLEGAYLSNALVERSQIRLQRLAYIETVEHETVPVPGTTDLVDINFEITEGLPGQFGGGVGFSKYYGATLNANFVHANFMGTGNRIGLQLNGGEFYKSYMVDYTDPYLTVDGLSRQLSINWRDIKQYTAAASDFSTETLTLGSTWSYPITEFQFISFGLSYSISELATSWYSSRQANEWVRRHGEAVQVGNSRFFMSSFKTWDFTVGWMYDSRNRALFPTSGTRAALNLSGSIPGSEVEFYVASLAFTRFFPLTEDWLIRFNSTTSYGDAYGDHTLSLPPFRNFFGGGPGTVRGYRESYMGPVDSWNNPYGGNLLIANQFELIVPIPEDFRQSARVALFYDIGGVYDTSDTQFFDRLGDPMSYDYSSDALKHSIGLGVEWLAPVGVLKFSLAQPLNANPQTERFWGDRDEVFQFTVGNAF
ncbi:MAG: outer membrane protein assembly factor BamA [Rhodospirillaceae bacterium]|nr:outer membrane protein assembly factor BamA [Rhodospirillaceae bacterium]